MMNNISSILKNLIKKAHISEQELARRTSLNQSVIHRLISGENQNPTLASLKAIASYFLITISQLIGEEPIPELSQGRHNTNHKGWKKIPILSWEQAVSWKEHLKAFQKDLLEFRITATDTSVSDDAFSLIINGSSMEPRFEKGMVIVVDPQVNPEDKDFVVIQTRKTNVTAFKEIIIDGDVNYVRSLNPTLGQSTVKLGKSDKIIATMVQAINYRV